MEIKLFSAINLISIIYGSLLVARDSPAVTQCIYLTAYIRRHINQGPLARAKGFRAMNYCIRLAIYTRKSAQGHLMNYYCFST